LPLLALMDPLARRVRRRMRGIVQSLCIGVRTPAQADARGLTLWRACVTLAVVGVLGGCTEATTLTIPVVYIVAGRVLDPATSPVEGIPGARVFVDSAPQVASVTTDADGNFVLQGVPDGVHRLRAELTGRRTTLTYDFVVRKNVADALVPLFTDTEIDSVLNANGAPAWDRAKGLLGLFALKSTGVPLGDALVTFAVPPGGTLVQTGEGKDPIVVVNADASSTTFSLARGGYVWDGPYTASLRPGVVVFAAPRARPNFNGFVFADNSSGPPVDGGSVAVLEGPTAASTTTNFLGQFSLVGLSAGRYVARITAAGFLPTVVWPQPLDQDTTLAQVLVTPDTLAEWATPVVIDPARGHLRIDARDVGTGSVLDGATVEVVGAGEGSTAIAQTQGVPALRVNLLPGLYRVFARAPGRNDSPAADSVRVRAGEVTSTRVDF
jgi:hypothetical protein